MEKGHQSRSRNDHGSLRTRRVGYAMNGRKQTEFFAGLRELADLWGWPWVWENLGECSLEQPSSRYDLILSKQTDDMIRWLRAGHAPSEFQTTASWIRPARDDLRSLKSPWPSTPILDPLDGVWTVIDRIRTREVLRHCVEFPPWTMVTIHKDVSTEGICASIADVISYPVVLKSRLACGFPESHVVHLVSSDRGLRNLISKKLLRLGPGPTLRASDLDSHYLVERFIPHGSVLWKVYCIGTKYNKVMPTSTLINWSDPELQETLEATGWITFDPKTTIQTKGETSIPHEKFTSTSTREELTSESTAATLPPIMTALVIEWIQCCCEQLGLSLLGIDVVIPEKNGRIVAIDVNYFPAYRGLQDAHPYLLNVMRSRMEESEAHIE